MKKFGWKLLVLVGTVFIGAFFVFSRYKKNDSLTSAYMSSKQDMTHGGNMKKKIMIFTSSGGRGHVSATEALMDYCADLYDVQPVYALREILGPVDFIYTLTAGRYHSEELYNYFMMHNYTWLIPAMVWLGEWFFTLRAGKIESLIEEYVRAHKPDLLISVIPMVNGATIKAAQRLQIPFWVISTDLDAQKFVYQIHNPTYEKFFFNVAYNNAALMETFASAMIPDSCFTYTGFPVRPSFIASDHDSSALKKTYDVPTDKPVVMLLMGGLGSRDTLVFAQELARISLPVHILICIGKSEGLRPELERMMLKNHISYTIIGFTEKIDEIMAMSDLLITKSGGLTINEALYMELPMIVDATVSGLIWERFNRTFIHQNNVGAVLHDRRNLASMVEALLRDPHTLETWKHAIRALEKKDPKVEIVRFIQHMIG